VPQRIGNERTAAIRASINAVTLADYGDDDDVKYSLFGEAPIPSRKLGEGQDNDNDDSPPPFEN
jgi:hypothetical protein